MADGNSMVIGGVARVWLTALVGLFLLIPASAMANESDVRSDVVALINRVRADEGLPALAVYPDSSQVVRANAHYAQTGQTHATFQQSADYYMDRGATGLGENQAYSSNGSRRAGWVVSEWLQSGSHRDVMMTAEANYVVVAVSCADSGMRVTAHVITVPDGARGPATAGGGVSPDEGSSCDAAPPPPPPPAPPPPPPPPPPPTTTSQDAPPHDDPEPDAGALPDSGTEKDEVTAPPNPEPPESPPPGARVKAGLAPLEVRTQLVHAAAPPPERNAAPSRDGSLTLLAAVVLGLTMIRARRRNGRG